ncbi:MAG: DUF4139 domain-containing protein [Bacteroidales bacterium]|nr:DUF4139 domain-containing protein [Bacteroidales bacterium]
MKKLLFVIVAFLTPFLIKAQDVKEIEIKSEISSATVYLNNAEITRLKNVNLSAGRTLLIFKGLSPVLDDASVRVTIGKDVDILQISTVSNYMTKDEDKPQIKMLNDSLKLINLKLQNYTDELDAYRIEKDLLITNKEMGGQNDGVSIDELKISADYYRNRIMEINKKVSSINLLYQQLVKDKSRVQNQLYELNANSSFTRKEVRILVESKTALNADVDLKYLVSYAGWSPIYDLKAKDTDAPISLVYRANVYNNTGIDWKNIDLTLSTNDANLSNSKPVLSTWFLKETATVYSNMAKGEGYVQQMAVPQSNDAFDISGQLYGGELTNAFEYEAVVPVLSHEFKIDKKYSVPADDKPYLVYITEEELKADYQHFAITKLDPGVFLLAKVIGWEDLNLIDGPAKIYYAGSYIGNSFISTRNVTDTLDFSLGRDNRVMVTRHDLNKFSSSQMIGNKKKTTFEYQYELKNNHKSQISLELTDQIPISQSDEIEVKVIELSGGELTESTGEVVWKVTLNPGEMKKINFSFSVKYPKNSNIPLKQNESKNLRYFY